jgi:hypothetical protein
MTYRSFKMVDVNQMFSQEGAAKLLQPYKTFSVDHSLQNHTKDMLKHHKNQPIPNLNK